FRIGIRVERRFDVRQCRELARQPHALERVRDVIVPSAGANEAFTEPIRLAELETDFFGSLLETRATRVARPERLHALFFRAQLLRALSQPLEDAHVLLLGLIDAL